MAEGQDTSCELLLLVLAIVTITSHLDTLNNIPLGPMAGQHPMVPVRRMFC